MNHEHARPGGSDRQDRHGRYETHEAPVAAENSSDEPGGTAGSAAGPDAEERTAGGPEGASAEDAPEPPTPADTPRDTAQAGDQPEAGSTGVDRPASEEPEPAGLGARRPESEQRPTAELPVAGQSAAGRPAPVEEQAGAARVEAERSERSEAERAETAGGMGGGGGGASAGRSADASAEPETAGEEFGGGLAGLGGELDEQALRRMLQGAVENLEPTPEALDHLRRAVPARRTRRRQALVGAAAAIVLGGAAIPAFVHVTAIGDDSHGRPANAASSERTPEAVTGGHHGEGGPKDEQSKRPSEKDKEKAKEDKKEKKKDKPTPRPTHSVAPPPLNPSSTLAATSPTCARDQLGDGGSSASAADAEGQVYGSFRVVNTSGDPCTVEGSGVVGAMAQGAADPSSVQVVDHTVGDPATQLPPPSAATEELILQPGQAYEVRYAWIPTPGGGASGCADTSTPSPTPTTGEPQKTPVEGAPASEAPGDTAGPGSGTGGGGGGEEPATPSSVVISHTPDAGDPVVASATVPEACAGTVYHTGALPSP
ncbi:hypothetical protein H8N00_34255 [Streptomyces sp. AC563]|uniref:hypothetical protein n=2 Tax=Streptomyces buecherae TaxID=2763006 RepID=UPI00164DC8A4|nr:hypothetical protein [Streptomyces buecherae]MBC3993850.1 hypothetical protein [Streptomyces buecherae]